ncbi:MAG TPA: DUF6519 domain-containing protein [Candidatus Elarobacter sp.]|jgi:hypothetical protein
MIVRVVAALFAVAFFATVRGMRRRSRSRRAAPRIVATLTVRTGYTGLENALYRVTIERGGTAGAATFAWSRDDRRAGARTIAPVQVGPWMMLEDGVEICFAGEAFETGEYWTFPARIAADSLTLNARSRGKGSGRSKRRS